MDVKEAVASAKKYILDLFAEEDIKNLGLEEVEFYDTENAWHVTIAFSRPWDNNLNAFAVLRDGKSPPRSFKVVRILDNDGKILSVKNRDD